MTASSKLPGAEFEGNVLHLTQRYRKQAHWLNATTARRIASCYGSLAASWLPAELTVSLVMSCVEEVDYLIDQEWACTAEDIFVAPHQARLNWMMKQRHSSKPIVTTMALG